VCDKTALTEGTHPHYRVSLNLTMFFYLPAVYLEVGSKDRLHPSCCQTLTWLSKYLCNCNCIFWRDVLHEDILRSGSFWSDFHHPKRSTLLAPPDCEFRSDTGEIVVHRRWQGRVWHRSVTELKGRKVANIVHKLLTLRPYHPPRVSLGVMLIRINTILGSLCPLHSRLNSVNKRFAVIMGLSHNLSE